MRWYVIEGHISNIKTSERSKRYREIKSKLQDEWRDKIFSRDQYQCRACGSKEHLHLAHITTVRAFLLAAKAAGEEIDNPEKLEKVMRKAYREDNLITLCSNCHKAYHGEYRHLINENEKLKNLLNMREQMRKNPIIQEYLSLCEEIDEEFQKVYEEADTRRCSIQRLFREIKKERGWSSAKTIVKNQQS
ncbi:MAG: HNH endonuclease [Methermicoccaceae archaeon]